MVCITPLFARKVKGQRCAFDLHVLVQKRRQPEGLVGARVLLVPHADQRLLEQRHDDGQHMLARQRRFLQVGPHALANRGQRESKLHRLVVLRCVAHRDPLGVIPMLLAPPCVAAGGLKVAGGVRRNPYVGPRWWYHQRSNSLERPCIANPATAGVAEGEGLSPKGSGNSRLVVADILQSRRSRRRPVARIPES
jgi:hypothetical protein